MLLFQYKLHLHSKLIYLDKKIFWSFLGRARFIYLGKAQSIGRAIQLNSNQTAIPGLSGPAKGIGGPTN